MNTLKLSMFWTIFTNLWIHCFRPVSCVKSSQDLYVIVYIEFGLLVHTKLTKLWWSNLCITPLTQLSSRGNQKMFYFAFVWSLSIRLHLNSLKMKKKNVFTGPDGLSEGDWICPKCENVNFAFRTTCNIKHCGAARPVSVFHLLHESWMDTVHKFFFLDQALICTAFTSFKYL